MKGRSVIATRQLNDSSYPACTAGKRISPAASPSTPAVDDEADPEETITTNPTSIATSVVRILRLGRRYGDIPRTDKCGLFTPHSATIVDWKKANGRWQAAPLPFSLFEEQTNHPAYVSSLPQMANLALNPEKRKFNLGQEKLQKNHIDQHELRDIIGILRYNWNLSRFSTIKQR